MTDTASLQAELDELAATMKPMHLAMAVAMANGSTQTQAYKDAGGEGKNPRRCAADLIRTNPYILEYSELAKRIASLKTVHGLEITEERIMRELARIGFASIKKLYAEDGRLLEPWELDDDTAAAVVEVRENILRAGKDDEGEVIQRTYKLASGNEKKGALETLGKSRALQMFTEKVEVEAGSGLSFILSRIAEKTAERGDSPLPSDHTG